MTKIFPNSTYWEIMPYYLALSFGTAFLVMGLSHIIRNGIPLWYKVKPLLIVQEAESNEREIQ